MASPSLKLSVVIPAHNEAGSIAATVGELTESLDRAGIEHEIVVIDDASTDHTAEIVGDLAVHDRRIRCLQPAQTGGFGLAVRAGLAEFEGDAVAIVMADGSDDPEDLVSYHAVLERATTARSDRASSPAAASEAIPVSSSSSTVSSIHSSGSSSVTATTTRRMPSRPTVAR